MRSCTKLDTETDILAIRKTKKLFVGYVCTCESLKWKNTHTQKCGWSGLLWKGYNEGGEVCVSNQTDVKTSFTTLQQLSLSIEQVYLAVMTTETINF